MTLIKSISGIRGTIGGIPGENLSPIDIVKFTAAYGSWAIKNKQSESRKIVVGRDARLSGKMISDLVIATLIGLGLEVVDLGLSTTPTVEIAVPMEKALGGIILTASHNPKQWNALKLLNEKGEFISDLDGKEILDIATNESFSFASIDDLGNTRIDESYLQKHIDLVLNLPLVDVKAIRNAQFKIALDAVNSTGGIFIPELLRQLGVEQIEKIHCTPNGVFPHNPEPLPEHLGDISSLIKEKKLDLGIVVDPDVDRLAFVCEDGSMFGEEYTLVAVANYILKHTPGATVSNLSSTRALRDITEEKNCLYHAASVGEVNVVETMKNVNAVIGGEGNGGIIYPEAHYGRDALVGIALFLSYLAKENKSITMLRDALPKYTISKNKIDLIPNIDVDTLLQKIASNYQYEEIDTRDGVKIYIGKEWVHLRKSNTEPIIRIYSESKDKQAADQLAMRFIEELKSLF
jgi:phosphomannomutase